MSAELDAEARRSAALARALMALHGSAALPQGHKVAFLACKHPDCREAAEALIPKAEPALARDPVTRELLLESGHRVTPMADEPKAAQASPLVHFSDWASQPQVRIACDQSYTTPKWGQRPGMTDAEGVYQADDDRLYTFEEGEKVTCPRCREVMPPPRPPVDLPRLLEEHLQRCKTCGDPPNNRCTWGRIVETEIARRAGAASMRGGYLEDERDRHRAPAATPKDARCFEAWKGRPACAEGTCRCVGMEGREACEPGLVAVPRPPAPPPESRPVEACGCQQSDALKAEVERLRAELARVTAERDEDLDLLAREHAGGVAVTAERDRLAAEVRDLRGALEALDAVELQTCDRGVYCVLCDVSWPRRQDFVHEPGCPVRLARAALATRTPATEAEERPFFRKGVLLCQQCNERPAVCVGRYEGSGPIELACDVCCGHGCEDGWCVRLADPCAATRTPEGAAVLVPKGATAGSPPAGSAKGASPASAAVSEPAPAAHEGEGRRAADAVTVPTTAAANEQGEYCTACGWRKGGVDSWDGINCKCGPRGRKP